MVPTPACVTSHQSGWMIDEGEKTVWETVFPRRGELGVVVAGVEVLQAGVGIIALADPAFGDRAIHIAGQREGRVGGAIGPVDPPFGLQPPVIARRADDVLSVLPTHSARGALRRLAILGVPEFLARDVLRGVLGQRLVVVSCPACGGAGCGACGGSGAVGRRVEAELWLG